MKRLGSWLGDARVLGSAKSGSIEWWRQRITAIALFPLGVWLISSLVQLPFSEYDRVHLWLSGTIPATAMIILLVLALYHAALGMQVVYEDYIHNKGLKIASILVTNSIYAVLGVIAVLSILKVYFSGD